MHTFWKILRQTVAEFGQDKAPMFAAALAYYTIFALAPLLLVIISAVGLIFGEATAQSALLGRISDAIGAGGAQVIDNALTHLHKAGSGLLFTILGIVIALVGATGLLGQLQTALNMIWDIRPEPAKNLRHNLWRMLERRLVSLALIVLVSLLLLSSLALSAALSFISNHLSTFPGSAWFWQALNIAIFFGLITVLLAFIYKFLPAASVGWRDVWLGAAVTSFLFAVGKYAIGLYLGHTSVSSLYGAAGSVIVLLLWIYYSAQILLLGAEFTHVYAKTLPTDPPKAGSQIPPADADKTAPRSLAALLTGVALTAGLELLQKRNKKEQHETIP